MPNTFPRQGPISRLTGGTRPMRPRTQMKVCSDGTRVPVNQMCPRRRRPISRAEQFKRERLNKQRTQPY